LAIRIFTDGACTGNGTPNQKAGVGVVIEWQGKTPLILSKGIGNRSNNEAEYEGLLESLLLIRDENIKDAIIHSDSNLMVQQVNKVWKCKDDKLKYLLSKAHKRLEWLKNEGFKVELIYIPRELNLADKPAKQGKSLEEGKVLVTK
jgi:ribonuclease HI